MQIVDVVIAATGAAGMVGWFLAWRSRGEALAAAAREGQALDRSRAQERYADAANASRNDATRREVAALAELDQARVDAAALQRTLAGERAETRRLIARLAENGVPVGGMLVDGALDGLYPDDHSRPAGGGSGGGADPVGVPGDSAGPAGAAASGR